MKEIVELAHTAKVAAVDIDSTQLVLYQFYGAPSPDGVTEKRMTIELPRNAIVRKYELVLKAAMAHSVRAGDAGQVRITGSGGKVSVVVDFGTLRTVSAIGAPAGCSVESVSCWIGTEFGPPKLSEGFTGYRTLTSEVRTERLLVILDGAPSTDQVATEMLLVLPESPAGIELRIDGNTVVFSQTAAVDPSSSAELSALAWNENSERIVDVAAALARLTGDPLDESTVSFDLRLSSRVPGLLDLGLAPGGQDVLRIRRAKFDGQTSRELTFESEGRQTLALESLPPNLTLAEARLTVLGRVPSERIVPALGPEPPQPAFATIALSSQRAACIRVPDEARLGQLAGVRVALAAGASGAEARVQLWRSKSLDDVSPEEPLSEGTSDAVVIEGPEGFRTFSWKKAISPPADGVLWAVVSVHRGEASMTLADASAGVGAERLLWGAPTGPFHDLPAALATARGRIRVIGQPASNIPFAPLQLGLGASGAALEVTPNPKGTAVVVPGPVQITGVAALVVTSLAPGTLTLENVDLISTG